MKPDTKKSRLRVIYILMAVSIGLGLYNGVYSMAQVFISGICFLTALGGALE